ncbi:TspO/MBR family protein [Pricia sp. S334]|uniref:TspO/MBR family protein n=1 Tax=Pricia mediterranea TaxID=3076079 RepID=A0ABU3L645_9FLAO|nr:TspO/MBR family protein [Pricia sp. S334]MDT7829211.1 TspO/MBR family protein [Pricia sp. S334]
MKRKATYIFYAVGICLATGFLAGYATETSVNDWYPTLNKPWFTPPGWLFAPVWITLYILMGISAGIVWARGFYHRWVKKALYLFWFQLLFNGAWSIVFFGLHELFWALVVIVILLVLIVMTIRAFKVVNKRAAWLLAPYLLWVCFATLLNYRIWAMN